MNINVSDISGQTAGEAVAGAPFRVERLGARLGAQIHGLDLKQEMSPATAHDKDNPVLSTDVWHSDTTFRKNPTKYTILRCQIIPKVGGDTLWADMEAAYAGLSETFKAMIAGLRAVHDFQNFRVLFSKTDEDQAKLRRMEELFPNPSHPVVRTHPVSGRKGIYVNPQFTMRIEGLQGDESRALLDVLFEQAHVPEYQFRLRWEPNTIVFWDNISTQHYAANDYYPQRRRMERTAVVGDVPV